MEDFPDEFEDEDSEDTENYEPDPEEISLMEYRRPELEPDYDEKTIFPTAESRALEKYGVSLYYP
jgi:hypothetical protein